MSYETWKKLHYATPASVFKNRKKYSPDSLEAQLAAAKHALVKWEGLLPSALAEHNLRLNCDELINEATGKVRLEINGQSCSLCVLNTVHHREWDEDVNCNTCGIGLYKNGGNCHTEYAAAVAISRSAYVRPMVLLLRRTVAYLERKVSKP